MKGRILFLVEGSAEKGHSPAARFRVFQFLPRYRENGWSCDALRSFPMKYFAAAPFFRRVRTRPFLFYPLAVPAVLCMAAHRLLQIVTRAPFADIVVVQRNLLPVRVFPALEWLASRLAGKMVFDFDDAIFTEAGDPGARHGDVPRILRWADEVVAGNGYLAEYAREHNPRVTVIPTVPPSLSGGRRPRGDRVVLGWIGTAPNIPYLLSIAPALARLAAAVPLRILTVSDGPVALPAGIDHEHRAWSMEEEGRFFAGIDVGLMPLPDDAWTRGKCAFKAIEYLSRGIPAVVSPVGASREIGAEGDGVLFASTAPEWEAKLSRLCADPALRDAVGGRGRSAAAARFSRDSAAAAYEEIFHRLRFGVDLPSWLAGEGEHPSPSAGAALPRISVIVPSFQQARYLERTIRSILNQGYPETEILVIDGGSTDGSVEILKQYERHLAYWCSEPDDGQADALNKGLARATGEIVGWQNSDDLYLPGAFRAAAEAFCSDHDLDIVHGNMLVVDEEDRPMDEWRFVPLDRRALAYQWNLLSNQSVFWRRESPRMGSFDPSFRFCMDYDFFERAVSAGARTCFLPAFLGAVRMHPDTKTSRIRETGAAEESRIRNRNAPAGAIRRQAVRAFLRFRRIAWHIRKGEVRYLLKHRLSGKRGSPSAPAG